MSRRRFISLSVVHFFALALVLVSSTLLALPVRSAPPEDAWQLDGDFGQDGEVVTTFGQGFDEAFGVAVQKDGKIVVAGRAHPGGSEKSIGAIARYLPDGSPDTGFGDGGTALTTNPNVKSQIADVAIDENGRILVAGEIEDGSDPQGRPATMLIRYTSAGQVDGSFGVAGHFTQRFGELSYAAGIAVYPSGTPNAGKIVVAGTISVAQTQSHEMLVLRLTANGDLDQGFGSGGGTIPDPGPGDDEGSDVAIDQNGRIIVTGLGVSGAGTREEVAVLKPNGTLDTSFGTHHDGYDVDSYEAKSKGLGVAVDPTEPGRFAVAGEAVGSGGTDMAVWRYTPDGQSDQRAFPDFFGHNDSAEDVVILPDGKVVLIGWTAEEGTGDSTSDLVHFALARFKANMEPDPTFGNDEQFGTNTNKLVAAFAFGYDAAFAGARQFDGDLVVVGGTNQAAPGQENLDFGIARFTGPGTTGGPSDLIPVMHKLRDFTLTIKPAKLRVSWAGPSEGGPATFDLRMQDARWFDGKYGKWRILITKTRQTFAKVGLAPPGTTFCFEARGHRAGRTSTWSDPECVAAPVDDKTLSDPGKDWYRYVPPHAPNYYNGTGTGTLRKGAELHLDDVWFSQLGILYTKCRNCGKFAVFVGDNKIGVVDTAFDQDLAERFEYLRHTKTPSRHDITIRVIDPGSRGVYIDGVGVSLAPVSTQPL